MIDRTVAVVNESGLHARPASELVAFLKGFPNCSITLKNKEKTANGKSIIHVLLLGAVKGTDLTVSVEGENEESVAGQIVSFITELEG